ncbi:hypothetical protein [Shewanella benthica]|nr:hypothetical protein [Shewanella benthica]
MKHTHLLAGLAIAAATMPALAAEDTTQNPYAVSILAGLESYPDSESSSMSRGGGLSFI